MTFAQRRPSIFFFLAALVITYLMGPAAFLALRAMQRLLGTSLPVNDLVMKFGPTLAGLLTLALVEDKDAMKHRLRQVLRWRFPLALYLFAVFVQAGVLLAVLFARGYGPEVRSLSLARGMGVFAGQLLFNVILGGGLGEEVGWRGFLLPQFCKSHSPLVASLFVALAWFAWHLPAYVFFGKGSSDPIAPFAASLLPFSLLLSWTYFRSGEGLLLPVLLHGSINASFYSMTDLLPELTDSPTFQPAFDWSVAGCWYLLGAIILVLSGFSLGRDRGARVSPADQGIGTSSPMG